MNILMNLTETTTTINEHLKRITVTLERPAFSLYYLDVLFAKTLERFPGLQRDQVSVVDVGNGLGLEFFIETNVTVDG